MDNLDASFDSNECGGKSPLSSHEMLNKINFSLEKSKLL